MENSKNGTKFYLLCKWEVEVYKNNEYEVWIEIMQGVRWLHSIDNTFWLFSEMILHGRKWDQQGFQLEIGGGFIPGYFTISAGSSRARWIINCGLRLKQRKWIGADRICAAARVLLRELKSHQVESCRRRCLLSFDVRLSWGTGGAPISFWNK